MDIYVKRTSRVSLNSPFRGHSILTPSLEKYHEKKIKKKVLFSLSLSCELLFILFILLLFALFLSHAFNPFELLLKWFESSKGHFQNYLFFVFFLPLGLGFFFPVIVDRGKQYSRWEMQICVHWNEMTQNTDT